MTIAEQLNQSRDALAAWARDYRGGAEIATDPAHLFALLSAKPGGVRACLIFVHEEKRGNYEETGLVDRTFWLVISRGHGFALQKGDGFTKDTAAGPPLYDLLGQAQHVLRASFLNFESTELTANFLGIRPFQLPTERPVDAYQLEFTLAAQLPAVAGFYACNDTPRTLEENSTDYLALGTAEYTDAGFTSSAGAVTLAATTLYQVEVTVTYSGAVAGGSLILGIKDPVSGGTWSRAEIETPASSNAPQTVARFQRVVRLAAGSVLKPYFERPDGGDDLDIVQSRFRVHRLTLATGPTPELLSNALAIQGGNLLLQGGGNLVLA